MKKKRCTLEDKLLKEGWFEKADEIPSWILARQILVNNQVATSAKQMVKEDDVIRIKEYYKRKYVNKGGLKLEKAIEEFKINVCGKVALDCGASTGGFTDCLISYGAEKVYAVDVGFGQLAGKLAINPKVINMEKTNLSDSILTELPEKPEIISLDLSYLSLKKAVPICERILNNGKGIIICLVKPIYEVDSSEVRRNGKINSENFFKEILWDLYFYFRTQSYCVRGITNSPVTGNKGTIEFFICLEIGTPCENSDEKEMTNQIMAAIRNGLELQKFKKE